MLSIVLFKPEATFIPKLTFVVFELVKEELELDDELVELNAF